MKTIRAALPAVVVLLAACASMNTPAPQPHALGWQMPLGKGTAASYVEFGEANAPAAIGILLSAQSLDGLPEGSDMHRCHGRMADGGMDAKTRCIQTFEYVIPLPDVVAAVTALRADRALIGLVERLQSSLVRYEAYRTTRGTRCVCRWVGDAVGQLLRMRE